MVNQSLASFTRNTLHSSFKSLPVVAHQILLDAPPTIYEFTTEQRFLEQYYKIREDCYREDLGLDDFSGAEDEYDRIGHIAIVRHGDEVIAGARLVICKPHSGIKLPLEEEGFIIKELFPELGLEDVAYCEVTRLAILPAFREGSVHKELTELMIEKSIKEGCYYHFSVAPLLQARNSRILGKRLGVLHIIRTDIEVPYKPIYRHLNQEKICLSLTYFFPEMAPSFRGKAGKKEPFETLS
jgi:hypothetical protein